MNLKNNLKIDRYLPGCRGLKMFLPSWIYRKLIEADGISEFLLVKVRKLLVKLGYDPTCIMNLHGKKLLLPFSSNTPLYIANNCFYDSLPQRLSQFAHEQIGPLVCVDVGANVGDTVAAFEANSDNDLFLAIEPEPLFNNYLKRNYGEADNVKILDVICSNSSKTSIFNVEKKAGTASIIESNKNEGEEMQAKSLDDIIHNYSNFSDMNMLKIDTDGHDLEVIAGARQIIRQNLPIILFECDAFSNKTYVEDCMETLSFFEKVGYSSFIIYDNFGYLMGRYSLKNLNCFRKLLFYQLTSPFYYFDVLLMKEEYITSFFDAEGAYFVGKMPNEALRNTTKEAIKTNLQMN